MSSICVIPARGGSKRIPRKNIKHFRNKPLISWTIDTAIKSNCFDKIIVSTDDNEIADLSISYGAHIPFLRPSYLSDDFSTTMDVMHFMVEYIYKNMPEINFVCCIYATAPLLITKDIKESYEMVKNNKKEQIVFGATTYDYPIQRALILDSENNSSMLDKKYLFSRSQDLEETFHDAGQFYWGSIDAWMKTKSILQEGKAYIIPRWRVQDIDYEEDWERAETIHKLIN